MARTGGECGRKRILGMARAQVPLEAGAQRGPGVRAGVWVWVAGACTGLGLEAKAMHVMVARVAADPMEWKNVASHLQSQRRRRMGRWAMRLCSGRVADSLRPPLALGQG